MLPWTPEFRSNLAQNLMQPFPHPNDGSVKIMLRLANWLQRYSSSKMSTDRHTDRRPLDWYTISSPWAFGRVGFGSGKGGRMNVNQELKSWYWGGSLRVWGGWTKNWKYGFVQIKKKWGVGVGGWWNWGLYFSHILRSGFLMTWLSVSWSDLYKIVLGF